MAGKVLVPISEHINRLVAIRFQCDIMGTTNLVVARTDSEAATLITSNIDSRDHAFILGSTNPKIGSLADVMSQAEAKGVTGAALQKVEDDWTTAANLQLYNDTLAAAPRASTPPSSSRRPPTLPTTTRSRLPSATASATLPSGTGRLPALVRATSATVAEPSAPSTVPLLSLPTPVSTVRETVGSRDWEEAKCSGHVFQDPRGLKRECATDLNTPQMVLNVSNDDDALISMLT
jgi:hypothetical protein